MNISQFLLNYLAIGTLLSAILVITSKNPVISVLFLISVFIHSACYLLELGVGFVGLSYLIIYVGAITVLFLFVIMMINIRLVDLLQVGFEYTQNLPLALILSGLFFYEILSISTLNLTIDSIISVILGTLNLFNYFFFYLTNEIITGDLSLGVSTIYENIIDSSIFSYLQIAMLGQGLYTYGSILLLLMGIILLLAMLGPIVLSIRQNQKGDL